MSTDYQFANACNRLKEGQVKAISVCYGRNGYLSGCPAYIDVQTEIFGSRGHNTEIHDEEMDPTRWKEYGKFIKNSKRIKKLELIRHQDTRGWVKMEVARCLQAFFEEVKENKSIENVVLDIHVCAAISALDLRYFFQNNMKLTEVELLGKWTIGIVFISPEQSANIAMSLRDISLKKLSIRHFSAFTNNGALGQILSACCNVKELCVYNWKEKNHITSLAGLFRNPKALVQELRIEKIDCLTERVENELVTILTQNTSIKVLKLKNLFHRDCDPRCFENLLCNKSSIETICQSNHSLEQIEIESNEFLKCIIRRHAEEYLRINKNADKQKVVQMKVMQYYLNGQFDASPLPNMPISLLPRVLGIDCPKRYKCTAVYNILKGTPELFDVSIRNDVKSVYISESSD